MSCYVCVRMCLCSGASSLRVSWCVVFVLYLCPQQEARLRVGGILGGVTCRVCVVCYNAMQCVDFIVCFCPRNSMTSDETSLIFNDF